MATRATQKLRVMHLYRRCLKDLFSWTGNRELFYQEVDKLRDMFEKNRNVVRDDATTNVKDPREEQEPPCQRNDLRVRPG